MIFTFKLYAEKNKLFLQERETVTSGSVNVYRARFRFSEDWEGLERTAVFRCGGKSVSVLLDESGVCTVPWEVLQAPGRRLEAGVYGVRDGETVLPTVWAGLGPVLAGAAPGDEARPHEPELWRQELDRRGNRLDYTPEGLLGLYAGDKLLSAATPASGGDGASDHRLLTGRDSPEQHPVEAIEGLQEALERIPRPMTADELRKILMNGDAENV